MAAARRALLVVNPRARRSAAAHHPSVLRALSGAYAVDVCVPASPEALSAAVRRAAERGAAVVIAAGGDGTVRLAAEALGGRECALGVLPTGTANDAARALRLPADLAAAAARIAAATARAVDLVHAAGAGGAEGAWLTVGGLGVVTAAALRATALRGWSAPGGAVARAAGAAIYRLAAAITLVTPDAKVRRYAVSYVTPAGVRRDEHVDAHGAFVANLAFCGGGLRVPGAGAPDDGAFELCFIRPAPRVVLAARFARLAAGLAVADEAVHVVAAREAHLVCDAPDALIGDGDPLAQGRVFSFVARPRALRVLA